MKTLIKTIILAALVLAGLAGCKKLTDAGVPKNQIIAAQVFSDSTTAQSALLNIYALYPNTIDGVFTPNISLYSDELNYSATPLQTVEFYRSAVSVTNTSNLNIWSNFYFIIYSCNDLINGLNQSASVKASVKRQYIGEAKFLRAFAYFYLTNLYGPVPLVLETGVNKSSITPRSDSSKVYQQIIQDLDDAKNTLTPDYPGGQKIRANQYAVLAFLSRVYLYQGKWPEAEAAANAVLNSGLYTPLEDPGNVFLANSTEAILQFGTQSGFVPATTTIIPRSGKPSYTVSPSLLNSFEAGDLRKSAWIGVSTVNKLKYYYPFKYKNRAASTTSVENFMAIRSAEIFLIRAEARLMQNNLSGALADVNVIRTRAGLSSLNVLTVPALKAAIGQERRAELFCEWGHRLLDLKREGQANAILGNLKSTWKTDVSLLLPVPQYEITHDVYLTQNPGY